ncbi:MAG: SPOR domain-containing protein [Deltaproteobacteria bacterium]|jgi:hypothetical protein|nr:SPOR domain-containing protein [Deltaproteobacteria bacterium]
MGAENLNQSEDKLSQTIGLPIPMPSESLHPNVSQMAERLLSKETTFFDHYRLKSLGGRMENSSNNEPVKNEMHKAISRVFKAVPPKSKNIDKPAAQNGVSPNTNQPALQATPQVALQATAMAGNLAGFADSVQTLSKQPDSNQNTSGPAKAPQMNRPSQESNKTSEDSNRKSKQAEPAQATATGPNVQPLKAESGWLASIKWLTRLCFSFLVLAWVFILGFIIGRISLDGRDLNLANKLSLSALAPSALASRFGLADGQPGPDDELEPITESYQVVIVSPDPDSDVSASDFWAAYTPTGDISPRSPVLLQNESRNPDAASGLTSSGPMVETWVRIPPVALVAAAGSIQSDGSVRSDGTVQSDGSTAKQTQTTQTRPTNRSVTEPSAASESQGQELSVASLADPGLKASPKANKTDPVPAKTASANKTDPVPAKTASANKTDPVPAQTASANKTDPVPAQTATAKSDKTGTAQEKPQSAPAQVNDSDLFWPAKPSKPGHFTIQVGSADKESVAKDMVNEFLAKGFTDVYCYQAKSGRYNIRVGRYTTESEGLAVAVALAAAGANKPYLSKLNTK